MSITRNAEVNIQNYFTGGDVRDALRNAAEERLRDTKTPRTHEQPMEYCVNDTVYMSWHLTTLTTMCTESPALA
eukprot:6265349-Amphidinium_carterae.9